MTPTISTITATSGRPTLIRAAAALLPQLEHGDQHLIERRNGTPWGNATRDALIRQATGSHLWWLDDDDMPTPNALKTIRQHVADDPTTIHIFRMAYEDRPVVLWQDQRWECGWIGGPMCVVPNIPGKLGTWQHSQTYRGFEPGECGDWHFLDRTREMLWAHLGARPTWHTETIARIRVPA